MLVAFSLLASRKNNSCVDLCCLLCRGIAAAGTACPGCQQKGQGHRPAPWAQPALLWALRGRGGSSWPPLVLAVPLPHEVGAGPVVHPLRGDGE